MGWGGGGEVCTSTSTSPVPVYYQSPVPVWRRPIGRRRAGVVACVKASRSSPTDPIMRPNGFSWLLGLSPLREGGGGGESIFMAHRRAASRLTG